MVPGSDERKPFLTPHLGLGLRALRPAWRAAFARATLREDALAGLRAAGLSLALALLDGQGVKPGGVANAGIGHLSEAPQRV